MTGYPLPGIRNPKRGIHISKNVLDYLTRSDVYLTTTGDCLLFNMNKILIYSGSSCHSNYTSLPSELYRICPILDNDGH